MITSENNELIKYIRSLQLRKYRKANEQFMIEGVRMISECLLSQAVIETVFYSEEIFKTKGGKELLEKIRKKIKTYEVSEKILAKLSETENFQGILAVVNMQNSDLQSLETKKDLFCVVLDRIQDPGNMGTIIRTAESANVDAVILTKGCVDLYNSKTIRSTMGALFHFPIIQWDDQKEWITFLKEKEFTLIAGDLEAKKTYLELPYEGNIAIIIGNEGNGLDKELMKEVHEFVKIPILGKIQSLNAAIAASILIYKAAEVRYLTRR
jgi:RNA methyltransferase, TrmH family